jgi:hypothetical protein
MKRFQTILMIVLLSQAALGQDDLLNMLNEQTTPER